MKHELIFFIIGTMLIVGGLYLLRYSDFQEGFQR